MITKEKFVSIINQIKDGQNLVNQVNAIFAEHRPRLTGDFHDAASMAIWHDTLVVELLEHIFKDDWALSYWIWEMDFGEDITDDSVADAYGTPMKTAEQLYDYLVGKGVW